MIIMDFCWGDNAKNGILWWMDYILIMSCAKTISYMVSLMRTVLPFFSLFMAFNSDIKFWAGGQSLASAPPPFPLSLLILSYLSRLFIPFPPLAPLMPPFVVSITSFPLSLDLHRSFTSHHLHRLPPPSFFFLKENNWLWLTSSMGFLTVGLVLGLLWLGPGRSFFLQPLEAHFLEFVVLCFLYDWSEELFFI